LLFFFQSIYVKTIPHDVKDNTLAVSCCELLSEALRL